MWIIVIALFLMGCQNENMSEFQEGKPHVLVDQKTGKKYVVEHSSGNIYHVSPLE